MKRFIASSLLIILGCSASPLLMGTDSLPNPLKEVKERAKKEKQMSVDDLKAVLKSEKHDPIVDLRTHQERVDYGYIKDTVNLDYNDNSFLDKFQKQFPDKSAPIILMCAVGGRVSMCYADLTELGYTNLRSVKGSYNAYKASGGEIVPGANKP